MYMYSRLFKLVFQFSDFLIIQVLRFCARAANVGGTHGLVVGREVWGARFFDPRGLGLKSGGCRVSFCLLLSYLPNRPSSHGMGSDFGLFSRPVSLRRHTSTNSILNVIGDMGGRRYQTNFIEHMAAFLGRFYLA